MTTRHFITLLASASIALAQSHGVHPKARPEFDRGAVDQSMRLGPMALVLSKTHAQQAALDRLLQAQQDPTSSQYHRWLTPEEFAAQFGAPAGQAERLSRWLEAAGFEGVETARGRDYIVFHGTAGTVAKAF